MSTHREHTLIVLGVLLVLGMGSAWLQRRQRHWNETGRCAGCGGQRGPECREMPVRRSNHPGGVLTFCARCYTRRRWKMLAVVLTALLVFAASMQFGIGFVLHLVMMIPRALVGLAGF